MNAANVVDMIQVQLIEDETFATIISCGDIGF